MSITIRIKSVYGQELIYPICDNAKKFALLANKKTLNRRDINWIKDLGFTVEIQAEVL